MSAATAGYSGTPLAKELGIKDGRREVRPAKRVEGAVRDARPLPRVPVALSIPVAGWSRRPV